MTVNLDPMSADDADGAATPPGPLTRAEVPLLTLHTRLGKGLFAGRRATAKRPAIIGLRQFAAQVRVIGDHAGRDDPYADWWLCETGCGVADGQRYVTCDA